MKLGFDLVVEDTDTPLDVFLALSDDDIKNGPGFETVIGNWIERAENNITPGISQADYEAAWSKQDTNKTRQDASRALVSQRGWTVPFVHWHEGDGTVEDGII